MRYIELCAGIGGTRAGLHAAGWECVLSVDNAADAVMAHRAAFGDCESADVRDLVPADLPQFDAMVAGFPCQPFSSSGHRTGFEHHSGNVYEHIAGIIAATRPKLVLLENVQGLLYNKSGHTFARVLQSLTGLGYVVDWMLVDLSWFGVPQTRPRTIIIARDGDAGGRLPIQIVREGNHPLELERSRLAPLLPRDISNVKYHDSGRLSELEEERRPRIGRPKPKGKMPFGKLGRAISDRYLSFGLRLNADVPVDRDELGRIVAPNFDSPRSIRSIRYWAYDGPSSLHFRDRPLSHCVGTSLGGAPLFAVPLSTVRSASSRAAFLEFSDWRREEDGYLVMRLKPERAVRLFGPSTEAIEEGLKGLPIGTARKFVLVGNMVPPIVATWVAKAAALDGRV